MSINPAATSLSPLPGLTDTQHHALCPWILAALMHTQILPRLEDTHIPPGAQVC
jgi:hypothetical protein